jgi:hypothetical protein
MSEYGDLVAAALHADAEAARAEIRAAGVTCPSCGVNMADLPEGHVLALPLTAGAGALLRARCADGEPVTLETWDACQNAAAVTQWDEFRRHESEALKSAVGEGPANFTGLLDVLNGEAAGS